MKRAVENLNPCTKRKSWLWTIQQFLASRHSVCHPPLHHLLLIATTHHQADTHSFLCRWEASLEVAPSAPACTAASLYLSPHAGLQRRSSLPLDLSDQGLSKQVRRHTTHMHIPCEKEQKLLLIWLLTNTQLRDIQVDLGWNQKGQVSWRRRMKCYSINTCWLIF